MSRLVTGSGRRMGKIFSDVLSIFYPNLCVACETLLHSGEEYICLICRNALPETRFHFDTENPVYKHFWGRIHLEHATSLYYFRKGTKVQHLLHELKYNGKKEIGEILGKMYGRQLMESPFYNQIDVIVPVPLHPLKQFKRGYNQSEWFARGLAASLQAKCRADVLVRMEDTATQTRKNRFDRWQNVEQVFTCESPQVVSGRHVLLVDDVITTGATMESCARALLSAGDLTKVSAVSIACAQHF